MINYLCDIVELVRLFLILIKNNCITMFLLKKVKIIYNNECLITFDNHGHLNYFNVLNI